MTNDRLAAGRVALVVGAAGELGLATAVKFADSGILSWTWTWMREGVPALAGCVGSAQDIRRERMKAHARRLSR